MYVAWIAAPFGVILTPHACPARCEGTAPNRTARLRSAPCLVLQKVRFLRRHAPPCQSAAGRAAPINSPKCQVRLSASWRDIKLPDRRIDADSLRHRHPISLGRLIAVQRRARRIPIRLPFQLRIERCAGRPPIRGASTPGARRRSARRWLPQVRPRRRGRSGLRVLPGDTASTNAAGQDLRRSADRRNRWPV